MKNLKKIETIIDRIQETIVEEEEEYGLFKFFGIILFFAVVIYGGITCYNMKKGLPLLQAVPCGSGCIAKVCGSCVVIDNLSIKCLGSSACCICPNKRS